MPTHVAIQPGVLYPQPGYSLRIDREGKWTATQVFHCHRNSAAALMPRPGTQHPDVPFISVSQVTATITEGDLAEIVCEYAGAEPKEGEQEKDSAVYTMGLSLSEEPIMSHPRYDTVPEAERDVLRQIASGKEKDDQGRLLKDRITSVGGTELLGKLQRGQTSYYSPRVSWRESWVRDYPVVSADLNSIGNISAPSGPAPALAGGRTWLLNGVTQTQEGNAFRIEAEWLASDRGGWDPDIYTS